MADPLFAWRAPEFEYQPKSIWWYGTSITIAAILVGVGVWRGNIPFTAFVIIAELLVLFWGNERPRTFAFTISHEALHVGKEKLYPLHDLAEFSIAENNHGEWIPFFFRRKKGLAPILRVYVPRDLAPRIRAFFGERIAETEWEPSFSDTIEKFSGF